MHTTRTIFRIARHSAALGVFLAGTTAMMQAQQPVSLHALLEAPIVLPAGSSTLASATFATPAFSSSSAPEDSMTSASPDRGEGDASQPPPRRRYGRPNYSDSHTNADGSSKFAFVAGAGMAVPTGDTSTYLTPSFDFQVGAGRNFSKQLGLLVQFDYAFFGFQGSTVANQLNLYDSEAAAQGLGSNYLQAVGGGSHVWSFDLEPIFNLPTSGATGAYIVAGAGFYHKTANFTTPTTGTQCDYYYGCYTVQANQTIDKYTSNAAGFNGGVGVTYKPSRFGSEKLYVEAKFVYVDNQPRAASFTNDYPPNANQTYFIPITAGLRW
jgi:hypothetical protein